MVLLCFKNIIYFVIEKKTRVLKKKKKKTKEEANTSIEVITYAHLGMS